MLQSIGCSADTRGGARISKSFCLRQGPDLEAAWFLEQRGIFFPVPRQ
jgi:hypothetical protein